MAKAKIKGITVTVFDGNIAKFDLPFKANDLTRALALDPNAGTLLNADGETLFKVTTTKEKTSISAAGVALNIDDKPLVEVMDKPVKAEKIQKEYEVVNIRVAAVAAQITEVLKAFEGAEVEVTGLED